MTEVRISSSGGKGLFATKAFCQGDLILEEVPVVKVAPVSDEESKSLHDDFVGDRKPSSAKPTSSTKITSLWDAILPPTSVPNASRGTFRGMVQTGLCWIKRRKSMNDSDSISLFELYHPEKDSSSALEQATVLLASEAATYLKEQLGDSGEDFEDWATLEKIMLVWACNSFEGGRIYPQISRINHDCNPNTIIQADEDTQRVRAATDIAVGDEITISYLGLLLYAETSVRKEKLQSTKYFECKCQRCSSASEDIAGRIPCPICHPRELPQQSLDEDVQYDDDQNVKYVTLGGSKCSECNESITEEKKLQVVMNNVTSKVVSYLDTLDRATKSKGKDDEEEDSVLEEHLGLASTIMGDCHWTTNLLKFIHLDQRLSLMSQAMLTTQELPEIEDVAEAIDSLQRLERFVQSLQLKLDDGHVLGDVTIGVARTLVSLGDVKSQKYGAEWLEKISDYISKFESEGRQKVVAALKVAWQNNEETKEDDGPATKKFKSS
jgi:hypothetical protein